jgi:hypothetical protein
VEKQASGVSAAERLDVRQKQSAPVLAALREQFLTAKEQLLPKHPMAEAISYAANHKTGPAAGVVAGPMEATSNCTRSRSNLPLTRHGVHIALTFIS